MYGFWGGEGRIQQEALIKPSCPPPLPRDQKWQGLPGAACHDCNPGNPHSHDRAALGLLLLEGGGEQVGLAGQVEESFGEAAGGARLWERLQLVDAGHRRGAEHAVDAFLRGERRALHVGLGSQLLGQSGALQETESNRAGSDALQINTGA